MKDFTSLHQLLERQCEAYVRLLEIERQKTQLLTDGKISDLDTLLNKEQAVLMECTSLENQRNDICCDMGYDTLGELVCSGNGAEILEDVFARMTSVVSGLKRVNLLNMKLLDTRLQTLRHMSQLMGFETQNPTYNKNAKTKSSN